MITAIKDGDGILSVSFLCESFSMFAAPSSMRSLPPSLTSLEINVAHGHPPRQVKYVISSIVKSFVCISNNQTNWRKFGDLWCFYSVSCGVFIRWFVVLLFGKLWNNHSVCWRLTVRWFDVILFGGLCSFCSVYCYIHICFHWRHGISTQSYCDISNGLHAWLFVSFSH